MTNPYVIFVGYSADNLQPFSAAPTQEDAIQRAIALKDTFPCVEAVLMPEDDIDTNEVIYSSIS